MKNYLMINQLFRTVWISFLLLGLSACSTAGKNPLPQDPQGLTMAQIYRQETNVSAGQYTPDETALINARQAAIPLITSSNTVDTTLNQEFKPLPNPEIGLYVYPHLVDADGDSEPVPGYMTAFFLYKSNQFALPSELY